MDLKNKDSQGNDMISNTLIKLMRHSIVYPLSVLINQSLFSGVFPDELKVGKVIPLFKKGDNDIFENYRPISILPSMSKYLKKLCISKY